MPRRRLAVITGGARGIGFGIAMAMLDADYEVTVTGVSEEEVAAVPERGAPFGEADLTLLRRRRSQN